MKITCFKTITESLNIEKISLLTIEEAKGLPEKIRWYDDWWWLQSEGGECNHAAIVLDNGSINSYGIYVDNEFAVRPVLTISNLDCWNLDVGNWVYIQGKVYVYIGDNRVLYDDDEEIVRHRFDKESNNYEQSEIKQIVDRWLEEE